MSRLVVAVDPGGRHTGIVLRSGAILHYWALVSRQGHEPLDWYLGEVIDTVTKAKERARELALLNLFDAWALLAVEDITDPTPQMGITSVRGLIDTAQIIGAISGHWVITRVPPGGHGSHPLSTYPEKLVGIQEKSGQGRLRHVRSAWDVAHTATYIDALAKAGR